LRVLLVAEQLRRRVPGGIGTYLRGLTAGLDQLDAAPSGGERTDLTLWASRGPGSDPLAAAGRPVVTSRLPGPLLTRAWDHGLLPAPRGFSVVHAPSLAAPPTSAAPLVVTVHDLAWRELPGAYPRRGRRWHEAALARALRRARLLVVPSLPVADALVAAGASPGRVEVVEEGSDHLPPPDHGSASELLGSLGVRGPYLLAVGTLEPRKNLERLLAAYARARSRLPEPWPLVVVGPRGWGGSVGVVDGALLAGPVTPPVLAALYAAARCLAYVPLLEGFGLPAVEAMRAGTPVLASPMPSTGGAALEVDPVDIEAIAEGLLVAAGDDAARDELVRAGKERASALTWRAAARRHLDLWKEVAR
jgi:glycosyltransferase involved in cell wall biosynthesis